ncbi:hypothetical protein Tco_0024734, partial [Tanacetum coccineum]
TDVTASTVPTLAAIDSASSHRESRVSPFADSADSSSPLLVSTDHILIDVLFEPTSGGINEFFLDSDEDEQIGMSRVAADADSDGEVLAKILFRGQYISGAGVVVVDKLPDDEIVDPLVKVETVSDYASSPPRSRRKRRGVRSDDFFWDKPVKDFFSSESESDDDMETLTVPPSYCRDVVVAGNVIQTVQAGLRESYECLASVPIACTARQMVFSSPWLTAKKESGSPLQTALVCNSNPLIAVKTFSNPLYGCDSLPKTVRVFQFTLDSRSEKLDWLLLHQDWKLLLRDVAASFDSAVHRVHAVSFDAAVASTVSAACCVAAGYIMFASADSIKSFLLSWSMVPSFLLTEIESADLSYRRD